MSANSINEPVGPFKSLRRNAIHFQMQPMYSIQFSDWGLVFEFTGPVSQSMVQDWLGDVRQLMGGFSESFSVVVDLKEARPAEGGIQEALWEGLKSLHEAGMERVAVVLGGRHDAWKNLPGEAEMMGLRYIVAREGSEWAARTHGWVQRGDEPDGDSCTRAAQDGGA
jgi:hypothetical protein